MTIRRVVTTADGPAPFEQLPGTDANLPSVAVDDQTGDLYVGGEAKIPGGVPGGSDQEMQFNDAGAFGGIPGASYDKLSGVVTISAPITLANAALLMTGLSTVDPNVNNQVWVNSGVLMLSAG